MNKNSEKITDQPAPYEEVFPEHTLDKVLEKASPFFKPVQVQQRETKDTLSGRIMELDSLQLLVFSIILDEYARNKRLSLVVPYFSFADLHTFDEIDPQASALKNGTSSKYSHDFIKFAERTKLQEVLNTYINRVVPTQAKPLLIRSQSEDIDEIKAIYDYQIYRRIALMMQSLQTFIPFFKRKPLSIRAPIEDNQTHKEEVPIPTEEEILTASINNAIKARWLEKYKVSDDGKTLIKIKKEGSMDNQQPLDKALLLRILFGDFIPDYFVGGFLQKVPKQEFYTIEINGRKISKDKRQMGKLLFTQALEVFKLKIKFPEQ